VIRETSTVTPAVAPLPKSVNVIVPSVPAGSPAEGSGMFKLAVTTDACASPANARRPSAATQLVNPYLIVKAPFRL
jgi:hypothetical protein